jgi:hypothetical protein
MRAGTPSSVGRWRGRAAASALEIAALVGGDRVQPASGRLLPAARPSQNTACRRVSSGDRPACQPQQVGPYHGAVRQGGARDEGVGVTGRRSASVSRSFAAWAAGTVPRSVVALACPPAAADVCGPRSPARSRSDTAPDQAAVGLPPSPCRLARDGDVVSAVPTRQDARRSSAHGAVGRRAPLGHALA